MQYNDHHQLPIEKTPEVLRGVIDLFDHPAWILDIHGSMLLNTHAVAVIQEGNKLPKSGVVVLNNTRFNVVQREINHGTGCKLFELVIDDDSARKLRNATKLLEAALDRAAS